jgi:hypothetical protein
MFYVASGTIAAEHPELADAVRALDEHLFRHAGYPLRTDYTAEILRIDPGRLSRLMELYVEKGVAKKVVGYVCPRCDGLMEQVPGEGHLWCDECEETVNLRGRGEIGVVLWQTLHYAALTGESVPDADEPPKECFTQVCIQFVGGDRGGAARPQLMLPREEKELRDAVNLGKHWDRFSFADSVHAASIDDVVACHRFNPGIVHFAGHGEDRQLILVQDRDLIAEQRVLTADQVVTLFRNYPSRIAIVFFNVCHSTGLAKALTDAGAVDMTIGVTGEIADDPAISFARTFYRQISEGLSVRQAFELAGLQYGAATVTGRHELFAATGIDPSSVRIAG